MKTMLISVIISFKYNFLFGLGFTIGPTFSYINYDKIYLKKDLLAGIEKFEYNDEMKNLGYKILNNWKTIILRDGNIFNDSKFMYGLNLGIHYDFKIKKIYITPNISAFGLFSEIRFEKYLWSYSYLRYGIDLKFE